MNALIYTYNSPTSFTRKQSYLYMTDKNLVFPELRKGDRFAVVPHDGLYSIYTIKGKTTSLLFDCNERDMKIVVSHSSPLLYSGVDHRLSSEIKYLAFKILDDTQKNAHAAFYKNKDSKYFNRTLLKSDKKLFDTIKDLSSGKITKEHKDKITIMEITQPLSDFKEYIRKLKVTMMGNRADVDRYNQLYDDYSKVFRHIESSVATSLAQELYPNRNEFTQIEGEFKVGSLKFYGNGVSFSHGDDEIKIITRDNETFDVYEVQDTRVKCVSSACFSETVQEVRKRYLLS